MPANVYMALLDLEETWKPLAEEPTVVNATVITPTTNGKDIAMRFNKGDPTDWPPGMRVELEGVDLAQLEASCDSSDNQLFVVGYTR